MASSSRAPQQQQQQPPGTYTVSQGESLALASNRASTKHLSSAADFITRLLEANGVSYAIMGGFSLQIRGSSRATHDVDLAIGCDMQQLIQILRPENRLLRPLGPVSGVMRIFVNTGGQYDPGVPQMYIGVDLILGGSLGAPDSPQASSEVLPFQTPTGTTRQYNVLNIASLMSSKLGALFARGEGNDFEDILFLTNKYPEQIYNIRAQLNQEHRQYFITTYAQRKNPPQNRMKAAKHILGVA